VRAVSGRRDLTRFIDLPFALHANRPQWVPPLRLERRMFLNRHANAFFSHGEAEYLLALRDGCVAGRISAHIDHAYNDYHGQRWGWFGFLELENDEDVARQLRAELDAFAEVYNSAWSDNWGFAPYGKRDLDAYARELQLVYDRHWFMVAERRDTGEVVGMAITVLDINQVLQRMRGRLLPLGWWHLLRRRRTIDRIRVGFLGVKPTYQHTGVAARLYLEHFNAAATTPQAGGEMGWILETNTGMNRAMEAMGGRIVKRYRMYDRLLYHAPPDGAPVP